MSDSGSEKNGRSLLARIGLLLQEESEDQWFYFGVFVAVLLVGAAWLQVAAVMPGVAAAGLLEEDENLEAIAWSSDGSQALMLVENGLDNELRSLDDSGPSLMAVAGFTPLSISRAGDGWIVGGSRGAMASWSGSGLFTPIEPSWPGPEGDVISISANSADSGWLLSRDSEGLVRVHSFDAANVSEGAASPMDSSEMLSVHSDPMGATALVLGYDMTLGNPTLGKSGEVLLRVTGSPRQGLSVSMLHHSPGGLLHTVIWVDEAHWGGQVDALVAGHSSTLVLPQDAGPAQLQGLSGSAGAAIDSSGTFWFASADGRELTSVDWTEDEAEKHKLPDLGMTEVDSVSISGDSLQLHGEMERGGTGRMVIDLNAQENIAQSLERLGELLFVVLVVFATVLAVATIWQKEFGTQR